MAELKYHQNKLLKLNISVFNNIKRHTLHTILCVELPHSNKTLLPFVQPSPFFTLFFHSTFHTALDCYPQYHHIVTMIYVLLKHIEKTKQDGCSIYNTIARLIISIRSPRWGCYRKWRHNRSRLPMVARGHLVLFESSLQATMRGFSNFTMSFQRLVFLKLVGTLYYLRFCKLRWFT